MAAAQHFYMSAKNYTEKVFIPGTPSMTHGGVYNQANIPHGVTITAFFTRGDNDAAAGTEGTLKYATADGKSWILFSWDIPWGAESSWCNVTSSDDLSLVPTSWKGDAIIRQTVTLGINNQL
jgi:hypothetical protein|tara:strand:- start:247 stop:612 length:366 start_codon:yes stop_codon:yes gene_type:complete